MLRHFLLITKGDQIQAQRTLSLIELLTHRLTHPAPNSYNSILSFDDFKVKHTYPQRERERERERERKREREREERERKRKRERMKKSEREKRMKKSNMNKQNKYKYKQTGIVQYECSR